MTSTYHANGQDLRYLGWIWNILWAGLATVPGRMQIATLQTNAISLALHINQTRLKFLVSYNSQ